MAKMKWYDHVAYLLLVVGALVHLGQAFNVYAVNLIFNFMPFLGKVVYGLVGLSGLYAIAMWVKLTWF